MVDAIPTGHRTVTPHLIVRGCAQALQFYEKAFGAEVVERHDGPEGSGIMHAQIRIGDSLVMLADEMPHMETWVSAQKLGGTSVGIHLYVEDVDVAFQRAVEAGATARMPPMDTFWGDRYGLLFDPFGHAWSIATHIADLTPEEMEEAARQFFASAKEGG